MKHRRELRIMPLNIELRAAEGDQAGKLVGHAAVFSQWSTISEPWFGDLYEEQIAPGAFRKTLKEQDIRALWNHDPNIVLGRKAAGTLELREDETGLEATITPPDNEWGRPVLDAVKRGDVSGMSIAFQVVKEEWINPDRKKEPDALRKRTIKEVKLFEVSPVTFPAYPQTDIGARADGENEDDSKLLRAFQAARLAEIGLPLDATERAEVRKAAEFMARVAEEPGLSEPHSSDTNAEPGLSAAATGQPDVIHSDEARARRLQLMKMQMEV